MASGTEDLINLKTFTKKQKSLSQTTVF